jgi:glycosyltransferase involved in cell wall biosynthesis
MKVALIHDHLAQDGGAEKVLQVFCDMYREAPIYTLLYERKNVEKNFKGRHIETSIIQKLPGGVKHYRWYLVFMPMAVEFFDLRSYDVVISDASAFAKGVITSTKTLHICYCHTPTRYLWSDTHQYINELHYNKFFKKIIALSLSFLRMWDHGAADRVDYYIANSQFIAKRIKKYYNRDSAVIYPPVEVGNFYLSETLGDYYLIGARLVPYKRFDIVIEAFKANGKKLKIFGSGIDADRLKKIAAGAPNIEFLGRVSDEERAKLVSECLAFIHPPEEDFGITIIEANASGRPVIAYASGGAKELVKQGMTGEFFTEQTPESLQQALDQFDPAKYAPAALRAYAETFSPERFKREIEDFVAEKRKEYFA